MMKELADAIVKVGQMPDVCAITFSASPSNKPFSAGVSIEEHRPESAYQMLSAFHGIFRTLNVISKPVVAVVSGAVLGGACELVACADVVIASPTARFGQPEIKIGAFPPGAAILFARIILGETRL